LIIVCSSISCALACGGNKACETLRYRAFVRCEVGGIPADNEDVSPNKVNLFRPRYTKSPAAILPKRVKPVIGMEVINVSTCRAGRGEWRERASIEQYLYLGDPFRSRCPEVGERQGCRGNHNPDCPRQRKSEWLVGVMTPGNAGRAKGLYRYRVNRTEGRTA
jgi:hypothetical protein